MPHHIGFVDHIVPSGLANLAAGTTESCTLEWLGTVFGFPCQHLPLFTAAVVAMAVLSVVITWAVKRMLGSVTTVTITIERHRAGNGAPKSVVTVRVRFSRREPLLAPAGRGPGG